MIPRKTDPYKTKTTRQVFTETVALAACLCFNHGGEGMTLHDVADARRKLENAKILREVLRMRREILLYDALNSMLAGAEEALVLATEAVAADAADRLIPTSAVVRCLAAAAAGDLDEARAAFQDAAQDEDSIIYADVLKYALAGAEAEAAIDDYAATPLQ